MQRVLILILVTFSSHIFGGVELIYTDDQGDNIKVQSIIKTEGSSVKMMESMNKDQFVLFDGKDDTLNMVNVRTKSYVYFDKSSLENTKSSMDQAKARASEGVAKARANVPKVNEEMAKAKTQIEAQLAQATDPNQKKVLEMTLKNIENMMGSGIGNQENYKMPEEREARAVESVSIKKLKSNVKIKKWDTTLYELRKGKKRIGYVWAVPFSTLGMSQSDFRSFGRMQEFMGSMNKTYGSGGLAHDGLVAFMSSGHGMPVRFAQTKRKTGGAFLESSSKKSFGASEFSIPPEYKKMKLGM